MSGGPHQRNRVGDDLPLRLHQALQLIPIAPQGRLGPPCQHRAVAAGHIQHGQVHRLRVGGQQMPPLHHLDPVTSFKDPSQFADGFRAGITHDQSSRGKCRRQLPRFGPLSCTQVRNQLGPQWGTQINRAARRRILGPHILALAQKCRQRLMRSFKDMVPGLRVRRQRATGWHSQFRSRVPRIDHHCRLGQRVLGKQTRPLHIAMQLRHSSHQPGCQSARDRHPLDWVFRQHIRHQLHRLPTGQGQLISAGTPPVYSHQFPIRAKLAQLRQSPQHSIDHARRPRLHPLLGEFHRFINRRMGGNAIKEEQLCGPGQ